MNLPLLAGVYRVVFTATDGGGNSASCESVLMVSNCAPATFSIKDSVSLRLDSAGLATLLVDSLVTGSSASCEVGSGVSFSPDTTILRLDFTCGDPADQAIAVYTQVDGLVTDTALVWVSILNKGEICQPCGPLTPCPDSIPPMLICASQEFRICTNPEVCLSDTSFLLGLGMDETTVAENLHFHYRVLQHGDTLVEREGHLFDLPLLAGVYTIELMVEDGAGNQTMCRSDLIIEDCCTTCSGLVVLCQDTIIRSMTDNKQAMVLLDDVDSGSFDDCGGEVYRSFRRDTLMPYRVITCADSANLRQGVLALTWYIGLSGEILDSCTTQVKVLDFEAYCSPSSGAPISKTIMNRALMVYNDPVPPGKAVHSDAQGTHGLSQETDSWKLTLSPNPAGEEVSVNLIAPKSGAVSLQLIGLDGKVWVMRQMNLSKGSHAVVLDLQAVPCGLYSIILFGPEPKVSGRLVRL